MYQAADNPAQSRYGNPEPHARGPAASRRSSGIAELTGMTADAARTYLDFHTGMRWLRRD